VDDSDVFIFVKKCLFHTLDSSLSAFGCKVFISMHEFIIEVTFSHPNSDDAHSTAIAFWIDIADELVGGSHDCCGLL
jgi:hypothetical protein